MITQRLVPGGSDGPAVDSLIGGGNRVIAELTDLNVLVLHVWRSDPFGEDGLTAEPLRIEVLPDLAVSRMFRARRGR